jgi:type II secretory pathway component PulF
MRQIISDLETQVEDGSPLWRVLESSRIFPAHIVSLIRIGEKTGKLIENLKVVAIQEQKERAFRSKIRSAIMYPVMVLSLTAFIGIGIAWFILPRLASVFANLKMELPLITKILIGTGNFLGQYGLVVMPVFLFLGAILVYFLFISPKTKFIGRGILFRFPAVKNLIKEVEIARFGYLLGTLLSAGLPITAALDSLHHATTFPAYKNFYIHLRERVEEGNSFKKSFALYRKFARNAP